MIKIRTKHKRKYSISVTLVAGKKEGIFTDCYFCNGAPSFCEICRDYIPGGFVAEKFYRNDD